MLTLGRQHPAQRGSGGATLRTFQDGSGVEWPANVVAYATTLQTGQNVLQPVIAGDGLPVQQDGVWTVNPGNVANTTPWLTSISGGGNTALVDSQGRLNVVADVDTIATIVNPVTVSQSDPTALKATVTLASGSSVAATQSGSWNVGVTGAVTVAQNTASNLLCTASLASGQTLATVTNVTTVGTITNPVATTQSGTWTVGLSAAQTLANVTTVGTVTNPVAVTQATASNLNATVSLAAAQTLANVTTVGTITNAVTVSQATAASLNCTANLAAGTNLVGKVVNAPDTSTIYNGTTAITPVFAPIAASASGDNQIVAATAGKKIRVIRWSGTSAGVVNIKWRSGTTDLTGLRPLTQYASAGGGYCPQGIFETAVGAVLNLNLSSAVAFGGELTYILI